MTKALLLDLDGTLAQSLEILRSVHRIFLRRHGKFPGEDEFDLINGPTIPNVVEILAERHGLAGPCDQLVAEYLELIDAEYLNALPAAGSLEMVKLARAKGWKCGIVTSNSEKLAEAWLIKHGFEGLFELVVGRESVTKGKPDPEPYLLALKKLGAAPSTSVALEDSRAGVAAALGAGTRAFLYVPSGRARPQLDQSVPEVKDFGGLHGEICGLRITSASPKLVVRVEGVSPEISARSQAALEEVWRLELAAKGDRLFNGPVLSCTHLEYDAVSVRLTDYRHFLAQLRKPELYNELQIRPLAVSGMVRWCGRLAFGKRADHVSADQGIWELAPSGGLTPAGGQASPCAQLLKELEEELGIPSDTVEACDPFLVGEDLNSHLIDIGIEVRIKQDFDEKRVVHRTDEYSQIRWVREDELPDFLRQLQRDGGLLPLSWEILRFKGLI